MSSLGVGEIRTAGLAWDKLEGFPGRAASFMEELLSIERL